MQGLHSRQYDAWELGITTSDDFTAADVQYAETLPAVRQALQMVQGQPPHIPVVTGFLGRGIRTGASFCWPTASVQVQRGCAHHTPVHCTCVAVVCWLSTAISSRLLEVKSTVCWLS